MSVDIATLELIVDATQINAAADALDRLADAGERTGRRATDLAGNLSDVAEQSRRAGDAAGGLSERSDRLADGQQNVSERTRRANEELRNSSTRMTQAQRNAADLAAALGALVSVNYFKDMVSEVTRAAAGFQQTGVVMNQLGKNAGYTRGELASLEKSLQATGISMQESRQTISSMIAAQLDLANATKLARLAQDAAAIAGTNSSEALNRMITGIQTAQSETLRGLGINVNFAQGYEKLALSLHRSVESLTEQEKMQSRVNTVMEKAPTIAGAYTAAMDTANKMLGSMTRYLDNAKIAIGEAFQPAYKGLIEGLTEGLKEGATWAGALAVVLGVVTAGLGTLTLAITVVTVATHAWNFALTMIEAHPIIKWLTLLAMGLTAVALVYGYLTERAKMSAAAVESAAEKSIAASTKMSVAMQRDMTAIGDQMRTMNADLMKSAGLAPDALVMAMDNYQRKLKEFGDANLGKKMADAYASVGEFANQSAADAKKNGDAIRDQMFADAKAIAVAGNLVEANRKLRNNAYAEDSANMTKAQAQMKAYADAEREHATQLKIAGDDTVRVTAANLAYGQALQAISEAPAFNEQKIAQAQALTKVELQMRTDAVETEHALGKLSTEAFEHRMMQLRLEGLGIEGNAIRRKLLTQDLSAAEKSAFQDRLVEIDRLSYAEGKAYDNAKKRRAEADRADAVGNVMDEGWASTTALAESLKAQEQLNAGIGHSVEFQQRLADATELVIIKQKEADAAWLRSMLLREKDMDPQFAGIYEARATMLERQAAAQRALTEARQAGQGAQQAEDFRLLKASQFAEDWQAAAAVVGSTLVEAFGKAGASMKSMFDVWADSAEKQRLINFNLSESTKDMNDKDPRKIEAQQRAQLQLAQLQIKSYGDMAGAAKTFFKEGTTGYKLLEGAEKAYRLFELALSVSTMVTKMAMVTGYTTAVVQGKAQETAAALASVGPDVAASTAKGTAAAAAGVANQATGDPYSAFFRMAAMAAAMAALGFAVSGGGGASTLAADRQKATGTGSILGDPNAQSDSIARAIAYVGANTSIELTHTAGMLRALLSIERNIGNLGNIVARSTAPGAPGALNVQSGTKVLGGSAATAYGVVDGALGGAQIGSMFGPLGTIAGGLIGAAVGFIASKLTNTKTDVQDQGLQFGRQSVGDVSATGVNAQQYATVNTKKSFLGITYSNKTGDQTAQLGAEANQQFTAIVAQMAKGVTEAAKLLGVGGSDFTNHLNAFVLDIGKITTKGKTTDEIQKALETAFAKAGDDMARWSVTGLEQFQKAGEGYLQTLARVASDYANLDSILAATGMSFGATGMASIKAREDMIDLAGGIDKLASKVDGFAQNFLSESERLAPVTKYVNEEMAKLGLSLITTRKQFKDLVLGLDLTVPANRELYVSLMDLQDAFSKTHVETEDLAKSEKDLAAERKGLQDQIDKLVMTSTQLRAKERATIDATNRNLYDQLAARQDIIDAYDRESAALQTTIDRLKSFGATLSSFMSGLNQGASSPLTPEQKNADAKKTYEDLLAKAKGGDATAQSQVTGAAQTYLTANRTINASSPEYTAVFNQVQQDMKDLLAATGAQQTDAERQLAEMKTNTGALVNLDKSLISLTAAIQELRDALHAAPGGNEIESMYKNILGRESDTAGLAFWTADHANGASLAQIEHGITMSDEAQGKRAADIENLYTSLLGRPSDAEGKAFWLDAYNHGHSLASIADEFKVSPEYKALHPGSHAGGLPSVPHDGYSATLHKGEAVIDASAMTALRRYFGAGSNGANQNANAALVTEIRALRAEVAALRADNERQNTQSIHTNLVAVDRAADKAVDATIDAARTAAWSALQLTKGVIK